LRRITFAIPVRLAPPDAMHLLGGIDEEEEEREGARGERREIERKGGDFLEEGIEVFRVGVAAPARSAGTAEPIDSLKRRFTLEPQDDAAERRGEAPHVIVKRDVFWTCVRPLRGGCGS
jgi:hypothetical protein